MGQRARERGRAVHTAPNATRTQSQLQVWQSMRRLAPAAAAASTALAEGRACAGAMCVRVLSDSVRFGAVNPPGVSLRRPTLKKQQKNYKRVLLGVRVGFKARAHLHYSNFCWSSVLPAAAGDKQHQAASSTPSSSLLPPPPGGIAGRTGGGRATGPTASIATVVRRQMLAIAEGEKNGGGRRSFH